MANKAILMCRVSTEAQDYEAQIGDLKKYATSKGISECYIIATKESGYKNISEREGWLKTKEYFEQHPDFDTLIVTETSRLGRRETSIAEIKEYMERNKKSLYIKDNDLLIYDKGKKQPMADIVFSILVSMATSEMSVKKDRFMRSKRELNSQGYSIVGKVLFGYKRVKDETKGKNKFVVNEKEAKEINEIYDAYLYGIEGKDIGIRALVVYAISKGMSKYLHSRRNMCKLLGEIAYIGGVKEVRIKRKNPEYWKFNDLTKPKHIETVSHIPYPAIVSKERFDAVQNKKIDNRIMVDKSKKHETILSKLIECPECHTFLLGDYRPKRKTANYRCAKHKQGGTKECSNSSIISMPFIDSLVWCYLKANVRQIIEEIYKKNYSIDISSLEQEICNCQEKKKLLQEEFKTQGIIFKNEVRIFGLAVAQRNYDKITARIDQQIDDLNGIIEDHKQKIIEIKNYSKRELTEEDMERVENNKSQISEYIHMLVRRIQFFNSGDYTFVRVILNGDDDKTFRGIFANKRNTIKIKAYGFKRESNMPFKVFNNDSRDEDGNMVDGIDSGMEILEKMLTLSGIFEGDETNNLELYPLEFKRLKVYDDDLD